MNEAMERCSTLAKQYLDLTDAWSSVDKEVIVSNLLHILSAKFLECDSPTKRIEKIGELTGSKVYAVQAWLNLGRRDVKIPLQKLCMIADKLKVDVIEFLNEVNVNA